MNSRKVSTKVFFAQNPVFTREGFEEAFPGKGPRTYQSLLSYHLKVGNLIRIKNGLYASIPIGKDKQKFLVNPLLIASKLSSDSIISHHSALKFHGVAQSMSRDVTFTTSNVDIRPFEFQNLVYRAASTPKALVEAKQEHLLVDKMALDGTSIFVTNNERTFVDCVDKLDLAGGLEEFLRSSEGFLWLDVHEILKYVTALKRGSIAAKVGYLLETARGEIYREEFQTIDLLRNQLTRTPTFLFRSERQGTLIKKWNIIVPEWVNKRSWEEGF